MQTVAVKTSQIYNTVLEISFRMGLQSMGWVGVADKPEKGNQEQNM